MIGRCDCSARLLGADVQLDQLHFLYRESHFLDCAWLAAGSQLGGKYSYVSAYDFPIHDGSFDNACHPLRFITGVRVVHCMVGACYEIPRVGHRVTVAWCCR